MTTESAPEIQCGRCGQAVCSIINLNNTEIKGSGPSTELKVPFSSSKFTLILFNLGNIFDVYSTAIGLSLGLTEANPIINYGFNTLGFIPTALLKLLIGAILSIGLYRRGAEKTLILMMLLIWIVVAQNFTKIHLLLGLVE